jgi:plasmid stabilization system protein ParE
VTLRFHRAARAELRHHAAWYEARRPMLGEAFATEVERAINDIARAPDRFPIWLHDAAVRRCLLRRFPFAIIYLIDDQEPFVLAIAHLRRSPRTWARRIQR